MGSAIFFWRWPPDYQDIVRKGTPSIFKDVSAEKNTAPDGKIYFKTTEQFLGFVVYVSMTYKSLVPYLKGIFLTLNSWQPDRDEFGWGIPQPKVKGVPRMNLPYQKPPAPVWVNVMPRLKHDVQALLELAHYDEPADMRKLEM
jgi:hypothetical protein